MNKLQRNKSRKYENDTMITCLLFTADWCNACKDIDLLFNKTKLKFQSKVNFKKILVDDEDADCFTIQYKIIKIPTIVIIANGKKINYINEEINEDILINTIESIDINENKNIIMEKR